MLLTTCSSIERLSDGSVAMINNVSYHDASFDNPNASNGFLVQYKNATYAVTAKHVLMIAKTDNMTHVNFNGALKQWKMHPKNDSTSYIVVDKLLNTNTKDELTWEYMDQNWDTYNDWLVFSIKENQSKQKALRFRETALEQGEKLYALGWTYKDTVGTQRTYEYTFEQSEGDYHNLIQTNGPDYLGGLSGAPIIDQKGKLVGLVSTGWVDEQTNKTMLQATSSKNIHTFIQNLTNQK